MTDEKWCFAWASAVFAGGMFAGQRPVCGIILLFLSIVTVLLGRLRDIGVLGGQAEEGKG